MLGGPTTLPLTDHFAFLAPEAQERNDSEGSTTNRTPAASRSLLISASVYPQEVVTLTKGRELARERQATPVDRTRRVVKLLLRPALVFSGIEPKEVERIADISPAREPLRQISRESNGFRRYLAVALAATDRIGTPHGGPVEALHAALQVAAALTVTRPRSAVHPGSRPGQRTSVGGFGVRAVDAVPPIVPSAIEPLAPEPASE